MMINVVVYDVDEIKLRCFLHKLLIIDNLIIIYKTRYFKEYFKVFFIISLLSVCNLKENDDTRTLFSTKRTFLSII